MTVSVLDGKRILTVDDEPDELTVLEQEIKDSCPNCQVDKATTYEKGAELINANTYDLVILDIMGVRGFDLLGLAVKRKFRVGMLTAHDLSPEALKKSHELGAHAYLPKDKLGEIVPFLEDILNQEYKKGWKLLLEKLGAYFDDQFDTDWKSKAGVDFWY
ncbi:MAG: response regulator [Syntrophorhabdales bacterium]|jgi:DNA-binding response OmpR family regulator